MTIIFQRGNTFWIDSIVVTLPNMAAGASQVSNLTIARDGIFMGGTCTPIGQVDSNKINGMIRYRNNSALSFGDAIDNGGDSTALECVGSNFHPTNSADSPKYNIILFMRGRS